MNYEIRVASFGSVEAALSSPKIVGAGPRPITRRTVFFENEFEDLKIIGVHVYNFKAGVIKSRVNAIGPAPFAARNEDHEGFVGDIVR